MAESDQVPFADVPGDDDGELVAAESTDDVVGTDHGDESIPNHAQEVITGRVPECVVDPLETVEVEDQETGDRTLFQSGVEGVDDRRPVRQRSQCIPARLFAKSDLGSFQRRDVEGHPHESWRTISLVGPSHVPDPQLVSVAVTDADRALDRPPRQPGGRRTDEVEILGMDDPIGEGRYPLLGRIPGELEHAPPGCGEPAGGVALPEDRHGRLDQVPDA